MSATLQQIEANELPHSKISRSAGSGAFEPRVTCVHRRSQTLLCSLADSKSVGSSTVLDAFTLRTYSRDRCGKWHDGRFTWQMPSIFASPPVAMVAIESMDVFMVCKVMIPGPVGIVNGMQLLMVIIVKFAVVCVCFPTCVLPQRWLHTGQASVLRDI